jgi:hypothetical protein
MSIGTMEVERLDASLEDTPPCEFLIWGEPCGKPSVARVKVRCDTCKGNAVCFLCAEDISVLRQGTAYCFNCGAFNNYTWSET